jgi:hypothetical protein
LAYAILIAIAQRKINSNAHLLILGLAIGTVPFHLGTTLVRMASNRSVLYCFGEQGLEKAMKYFRAHESGRENVMASRSFSRLAVQRYVPPELLMQPAWKTGALIFLADKKTRWVIFGACDRQPMIVPEAQKVLHDQYRSVDLPGDYQVYRRIRKSTVPSR